MHTPEAQPALVSHHPPWQSRLLPHGLPSATWDSRASQRASRLPWLKSSSVIAPQGRSRSWRTQAPNRSGTKACRPASTLATTEAHTDSASASRG
ncbi:hypothetical protein F0U59_24140 [Archangium gephyra]|nr:hypothetical protein F0U59_24140 [Archangium gephyra]